MLKAQCIGLIFDITDKSSLKSIIKLILRLPRMIKFYQPNFNHQNDMPPFSLFLIGNMINKKEDYQDLTQNNVIAPIEIITIAKILKIPYFELSINSDIDMRTMFKYIIYETYLQTQCYNAISWDSIFKNCRENVIIQSILNNNGQFLRNRMYSIDKYMIINGKDNDDVYGQHICYKNINCLSISFSSINIYKYHPNYIMTYYDTYIILESIICTDKYGLSDNNNYIVALITEFVSDIRIEFGLKLQETQTSKNKSIGHQQQETVIHLRSTQ